MTTGTDMHEIRTAIERARKLNHEHEASIRYAARLLTESSLLPTKYPEAADALERLIYAPAYEYRAYHRPAGIGFMGCQYNEGWYALLPCNVLAGDECVWQPSDDQL